ncbi:TetR-like C-terminal domain-containing protein [Streptomyces sp. NPDC002018]|uniref:TetR-like C-terminal domain-containing protein n=1 Tax=Streptomyces sp. NPDC002018 TaxID=3364629 RepID=UPI0036A14B17
MTSRPAPAGKRPPGGPVLQQDVTRALETAFFEELASVGYGKLSIEAVARRAGAGKAAVYRRWPSKQAMTVELASQAALKAVRAPDMGSLHADIAQFIRETMTALSHPLVSRIAPDLLAETARNEELADALLSGIRTPRRENAALVLHRAIERGELPADTDIELGLDFLVSPAYWRLAVIRTPVDDGYVERLTVKIIAAMKA